MGKYRVVSSSQDWIGQEVEDHQLNVEREWLMGQISVEHTGNIFNTVAVYRTVGEES